MSSKTRSSNRFRKNTTTNDSDDDDKKNNERTTVKDGFGQDHRVKEHILIVIIDIAYRRR